MNLSSGCETVASAKGAVLSPTVNLDADLLAFQTARLSLDELVNTLLKKGIELIKAAE